MQHCCMYDTRTQSHASSLPPHQLTVTPTRVGYCTDLQSSVVPKDIQDVRGVFEHYDSLTCEDIHTAARLCLRPKCVQIAIGCTDGAADKAGV